MFHFILFEELPVWSKKGNSGLKVAPKKKQLPSFPRIADFGSKRNMNLPTKETFVMDETGK